jgi:hypothetical protein
MDLQVPIGLVYFIWNGSAVTGFPLHRILHKSVVILAALFAHRPRFQFSVFCILGSLLLVVIGVSIPPHGWAG